MSELTLEQETALKVRELQVRFDAFETQNRLSDCVITESPHREPTEGPNPDTDDGVDRHHYLAEVNELTQEEWNDLLKI